MSRKKDFLLWTIFNRLQDVKLIFNRFFAAAVPHFYVIAFSMGPPLLTEKTS